MNQIPVLACQNCQQLEQRVAVLTDALDARETRITDLETNIQGLRNELDGDAQIIYASEAQARYYSQLWANEGKRAEQAEAELAKLKTVLDNLASQKLWQELNVERDNLKADLARVQAELNLELDYRNHNEQAKSIKQLEQRVENLIADNKLKRSILDKTLEEKAVLTEALAELLNWIDYPCESAKKQTCDKGHHNECAAAIDKAQQALDQRESK